MVNPGYMIKMLAVFIFSALDCLKFPLVQEEMERKLW